MHDHVLQFDWQIMPLIHQKIQQLANPWLPNLCKEFIIKIISKYSSIPFPLNVL